MTPALFTVTLTVDSVHVPGPQVNATDINIQYGIDVAIIEAAEYVCTNQSYLYDLANHTGEYSIPLPTKIIHNISHTKILQ
jgi:hypothetical protein